MSDLFFEIIRAKTHIFCEAKDTNNVYELKRIIEGILKIKPGDQVLKRAVDESLTEWADLDDHKSLADLGFTSNNAKAQSPATIALLMKGESEPSLEALSQPPPIPDSMRADQQEA